MKKSFFVAASAILLLIALNGCTIVESPSSGGSIAPSGSASGSIGASR